jgi:cyclic pyranopterin phosphate synthase
MRSIPKPSPASPAFPAGIREARDVGLGTVKVNCVLLRGFNDSPIEEFAELSRREKVIVRFIEGMPLEEDHSWKRETVVTLEEIVERLNAVRPLVDLSPKALSETARRFTFDDGIGEIGIIAPVSHPFCGHCSRVGLTSDGKIRTCFVLAERPRSLWHVAPRRKRCGSAGIYSSCVMWRKEARHHIGEPDFQKPSRNMVRIGG